MRTSIFVIAAAVLGSGWSVAWSAETTVGPTTRDGSVQTAVSKTAHRVFFSGNDTKAFGLWYSLGTNATTVEIGGLGSSKIVDVGSGGFATSGFAAFQKGVLFGGSCYVVSCLWYSDGTVSGTVEIGGKNNKGVKNVSSGLMPDLIRTFGKKAVFLGANGGSSSGALWATDGTAKGTVTLEHARGAHYDGLKARLPGGALTSLYVFSAADQYNASTLWKTDGTLAGTVEIGGARNAGISGVSSSGLAPVSFVAAGARAFFLGNDSRNHLGLWVTDGSIKGTYEVGGLANKGIANLNFLSLGVTSGVLGTKLLASGNDTSWYSGLWVSDGTTAGTFEVGGVGSANLNKGVRFTLDPTWMAVLGSKAVFRGRHPTTGKTALWVTDGTTKGTSLIFTAPPKSTYDTNIRNTVALGNGKALFEAIDASGAWCLFATDGTAGGTKELGGINNHGIVGAAAAGLDTWEIVAAGGVGYFQAKDASGTKVLWISDGTAAGTHAISAVKGQGESGLNSSDLTWAP